MKREYATTSARRDVDDDPPEPEPPENDGKGLWDLKAAGNVTYYGIIHYWYWQRDVE